MATYTKDPDATLDYSFDWSNWLEDGETIASQTITIDSGLTEESVSASSSGVTVWISGGTEGQRYEVACKITTDNSLARTDERTINIQIKER